MTEKTLWRGEALRTQVRGGLRLRSTSDAARALRAGRATAAADAADAADAAAAAAAAAADAAASSFPAFSNFKVRSWPRRPAPTATLLPKTSRVGTFHHAGRLFVPTCINNRHRRRNQSCPYRRSCEIRFAACSRQTERVASTRTTVARLGALKILVHKSTMKVLRRLRPQVTTREGPSYSILWSHPGSFLSWAPCGFLHPRRPPRLGAAGTAC
jgi:hypothetical protein